MARNNRLDCFSRVEDAPRLVTHWEAHALEFQLYDCDGQLARRAKKRKSIAPRYTENEPRVSRPAHEVCNMSSPWPLRFARPLSVAVALTCAALVPACGDGLPDEESTGLDDAPLFETTARTLGGRDLPGEGNVLQFDGTVIPQEAPVCQDCKTPGWAVGLTTIGGMPHLTLRAVSAGAQVNKVVGAGFVPTGDYVYVLQRRLVNNVWQDVPVWQAPVTGFDHIAWYRTWDSLNRTYATSTGVPLTAIPMSLSTVEAGLRAQMAVAANWRGSSPLFSAWLMVNGSVGGGGVRNPIPFP